MENARPVSMNVFPNTFDIWHKNKREMCKYLHSNQRQTVSRTKAFVQRVDYYYCFKLEHISRLLRKYYSECKFINVFTLIQTRIKW